MRTRKIIVEVICFVLLMNWFYEGVYKVAYWGNFGFYITHAPIVRPVGKILWYLIPIGEITLTLLFLIPSFRVKALYVTIILSLLYIFWIVGIFFFTNAISSPYFALWEKPTWFGKMLMALGVCWLAFTALMLSKSEYSLKGIRFKNMPAKAS